MVPSNEPLFLVMANDISISSVIMVNSGKSWWLIRMVEGVIEVIERLVLKVNNKQETNDSCPRCKPNGEPSPYAINQLSCFNLGMFYGWIYRIANNETVVVSNNNSVFCVTTS